MQDTRSFAAAVEREIIAPNLSRISAALGEEDEATVVASALHYLFEAVTRGERRPRCVAAGQQSKRGTGRCGTYNS